MKEKLTEEQKRAIQYEKEIKLYESHCKESYLFIQNVENLQDFRELIKLSLAIKNLNEQKEILRKKILDKMNSCGCSRALDLQSGKQLTISSGKNYSKNEFDVDTFKKENPEMYKKYCKSTYHYGVGGTLVLKDIGCKAQKIYEKSEFSHYFQPKLVKPEYSGFGTLYSIFELKDLIKSGCLTDYDGFGEYYDTRLPDNCGCSGCTVNLNDIISDTYPQEYQFVVWYNK